MIVATCHAIDRYIERVEPVDRAQAEARLTSGRIEAAAKFGAHYVRLGTGHRIVIQDGYVITVLPRETRAGYVMGKLRG